MIKNLYFEIKRSSRPAISDLSGLLSIFVVLFVALSLT